MSSVSVRALPTANINPQRKPLVWLLMGNCVGDNNQLTALARALGFRAVAKHIAFNQLRRLPFMRGLGLAIVSRKSLDLINPPWPDLVIGVGYGSVPVARCIRDASGGRAKIVHIGNPRARVDDFDLQITTPQYARKERDNMLALPLPIGNPAKSVHATHEELKWLRSLPRPRRLVAVGGPARHWQLDHKALGEAIRSLQARKQSGSLVLATSPRTPDATRRLLRRLVTGRHTSIVEHFPRFGVLLSHCDEIHVTADSVSMLSEAILTGKPVGMIPIQRSLRGLISNWLWERPLRRATLPNLRNFWQLLERERLIGTVELPVASQVCDTVERAADAVRSLLPPEEPLDQKKRRHANPHLGIARGSRGR
ncbi:MAG: ELM1/GtrOC1 family putative glycosyltransferase [Rhizomicrobium sp.]